MDRVKAILLIVGGMVAIGAGVFGLAYEVTDVDEVLCGERAMRPGQRCADNSAAGIVGGLIAIAVGGYRLTLRRAVPGDHRPPGPASPPWNPPSAPPTPPGSAARAPHPGPGAGPRGQDGLVRIEVSLVECATGVVKPVTVDTAIACTDCRGGGFSAAGAPCASCGTDGRVRTRRTIQARIPAGIGADQRVRPAGQGAKGPVGGEHGDLYLEMVVTPNPAFRREATNLHTGVRISVQHARDGGPLSVATLIDGLTVVHIAPGTAAGTCSPSPVTECPDWAARTEAICTYTSTSAEQHRTRRRAAGVPGPCLCSGSPKRRRIAGVTSDVAICVDGSGCRHEAFANRGGRSTRAAERGSHPVSRPTVRAWLGASDR